MTKCDKRLYFPSYMTLWEDNYGRISVKSSKAGAWLLLTCWTKSLALVYSWVAQLTETGLMPLGWWKFRCLLRPSFSFSFSGFVSFTPVVVSPEYCLKINVDFLFFSCGSSFDFLMIFSHVEIVVVLILKEFCNWYLYPPFLHIYIYHGHCVALLCQPSPFFTHTLFCRTCHAYL